MTLPPESRMLFWRISCWGEAGCSCSSNLIRAKGSPFLLESTDPSTSIITISAQRFWKGSIHLSAWKESSPKFQLPVYGVLRSSSLSHRPLVALCASLVIMPGISYRVALLSIEENPVARTGSSTGVPSLDEEQ